MNKKNNKTVHNFTELDKIFIPCDLDEGTIKDQLSDYKYNIKFFQIVPQNYSLVKKNIFTQENKNIDGYGLKFFPPLVTKTILVPNHTGIKKYNNIETYTLDGEEIKIDFDIVMQIIDPAKYIVEGKNKVNELNALVIRLLRIYISDKQFDQVIKGECKLKDFDPNFELDSFTEKYGIEVQKIMIEKVNLSENLKKLYNDAAEEKQKRIAQTERLQAETEKAKNDAKIRRINSNAEADQIKTIEAAKNSMYIDKINAENLAYIEKIAKVVQELKKNGLSDDNVNACIRAMILSENGNTVFTDGGLNSQNFTAGLVAGQIANNQKTKTR